MFLLFPQFVRDLYLRAKSTALFLNAFFFFGGSFDQ